MQRAREPSGVQPGRIDGLDAARALAVVAMVFGHSMHAMLSPEAREVPWVTTYWNVRAFTAPLFLFVSGWVVFLVITQMRLFGVDVLRAWLPRIALLFSLGFLLRLPVWNLKGLVLGDFETWRHLVVFDALHCIAASMAVVLLVCSAVRSTRARLVVLGVATLGLVLGTKAVWEAAAGPTVSVFTRQTLSNQGAAFPLFPWAGYFFAGAVLGAFSMGSADGNASRRRSRLIGVAALAIVAILTVTVPGWHFYPRQDPRSFLGLMAGVALVVVLCLELPGVVGRTLAPLGRSSLWAYVLHLPLVYGWGSWGGLAREVGPVLSEGVGALVAIAVVVASVTCAVVGQRLLGRKRWRKHLGVARHRAVTAWSAARVRSRASRSERRRQEVAARVLSDPPVVDHSAPATRLEKRAELR